MPVPVDHKRLLSGRKEYVALLIVLPTRSLRAVDRVSSQNHAVVPGSKETLEGVVVRAVTVHAARLNGLDRCRWRKDVGSHVVLDLPRS
jgi:hypothetical protein